MAETVCVLHYNKSGRMKYSSHRDLITAFYIAVSRAGLPVSQTEGFNRKPKISFGPPLPLGVESLCEVAHLYFPADKAPSSEHALERLNASFPPGYGFTSASFLSVEAARTLMKTISAADYSITIDFERRPPELGGDPNAHFDAAAIASSLAAKATALMAMSEIIFEKEGKSRDIRPYILSISNAAHEGASNEGKMSFDTRIAFKDQSTINPHAMISKIVEEYSNLIIFTYGIVKTRYYSAGEAF